MLEVPAKGNFGIRQQYRTVFEKNHAGQRTRLTSTTELPEITRSKLNQYTSPAPTQYARVDLIDGNAAASPFTLSGADVVRNFYVGVDPVAGPNGLTPILYTAYTFDITGLVRPGGVYRVRIADVGNQFVLNTGIDDVSVVAASAVGASAAEPGSVALVFAAGPPVAGAVIRRSDRRRKA